jgi:type IX secretion system PorP/SprF family membrane protein
MKINTYLTIVFSFFVSFIYAQQPVQYSMYMLNPYQYNAAYNGLDESLSATAVFRKQWVGFPGSPLGFNFNAHLPVEYINSGFGLAFEHETVGAFTNNFARASYSYIVDMGKNGKISIGAAFRFMQKSLDGAVLRSPDGQYGGGSFNHMDDLIPFSKVSSQTYSADAGVYYKNTAFEIGVSAINLTAPSLILNAGTLQEIKYLRNFLLNASYKWKINNDFTLQPSILIKSDLIKFQGEAGLLLRYRNSFFAGASFRGYGSNSNDAVIFLAGFQFNKNMFLAYSYDLSISSLSGFNSGSHEVVLNYNLNKPIGKAIPPKIIYNPRFL